MKLSLDEKLRVKELGERCANLLVDISEEDLSVEKIPTERREQFRIIISEMNSLCPLLAESYVMMYNKILEEQRSEGDGYRLAIIKEGMKYDFHKL
jgi:hypothetical protein